jgi:hypothetical protein
MAVLGELETTHVDETTAADEISTVNPHAIPPTNVIIFKI